MDPKNESVEPKHPWTARFAVAAIMLFLAFIGTIVTDLVSTGGWAYWKWIVPINGILALWLSWYERRKKETISPVTLWHEVLHWLGLFAVILLIEVYVETGLMSKFLASLVALTCLALTVFTIGVYVEWTFIVVGIVLALFALIIAIAIKYLYALTIPALFVSIGFIAFSLMRSQSRA